MTDNTKAREIVRRLRAPAYWMSGSSDGHEGENDAPREAADLIEALTAPMSETEALERAREAFLSMIADGSSEEEPDGDETGDCTRFIITTGHSQLDDLMDALGIPPARYMERTAQRLDRALDAPSHAPEPLPVKDEDAEWARSEAQWHSERGLHDDAEHLYRIAARLEEKRHG